VSLVESAADWFAVVGLAGITGALVNWLLQGRTFKKKQHIEHLKERIDKFYSPMIFHFENMRSWGDAWGQDTYVFAGGTLGSKIGDMNDIMRSGLRLVSHNVEKLWYEWQPYAVAAVERRRGKDSYPHLTDAEFVSRSRLLHEALKLDHAVLSKQYHDAIGEKNTSD
jgi:hypothetical protein